MARFSLGRDDDGEGPSSSRPKKRRTYRTPQQELQYDNNEQEDEDLVGKEVEEVESEYQEEANEEEEEIESEQQDEEDEEEVEEYRIVDQGRTYAGSGQPSNVGGKGNDHDTVGPIGDGSISVTLTDPDVLDCPICLDPLTNPVFQCENGHIACSSCCSKLRNKCPSCSLPIGYNRCRAIEKVLESVKISCRNMKYGCKETVSYSKKHDHEQMCIHVPCSCPFPECEFIGSSMHLYLHFSNKHSDSATRFCYNRHFSVSIDLNQRYQILQEQNDGIIFILNNGVECLGNLVNINCIGPSSAKRGFSYDVIVRNTGRSVRLQSFTESIPRWFEHLPLKGFLLVPKDFIGSRGQVRFDICIWKHARYLFSS